MAVSEKDGPWTTDTPSARVPEGRPNHAASPTLLIAKSRSCSVASVAPPRTEVMGPNTRSKIHEST